MIHTAWKQIHPRELSGWPVKLKSVIPNVTVIPVVTDGVGNNLWIWSTEPYPVNTEEWIPNDQTGECQVYELTSETVWTDSTGNVFDFLVKFTKKSQLLWEGNEVVGFLGRGEDIIVKVK